MISRKEALTRLVAQAEESGQRLYRLWCGHATTTFDLLAQNAPVWCEECEVTQEVMYRITPQTEPDLWPDWRTA